MAKTVKAGRPAHVEKRTVEVPGAGSPTSNVSEAPKLDMKYTVACYGPEGILYDRIRVESQRHAELVKEMYGSEGSPYKAEIVATAKDRRVVTLDSDWFCCKFWAGRKTEDQLIMKLYVLGPHAPEIMGIWWDRYGRTRTTIGKTKERRKTQPFYYSAAAPWPQKVLRPFDGRDAAF